MFGWREEKMACAAAMVILVMLVASVRFVEAYPNSSLICIIVESMLYDQLETEIERYIRDIAEIGFDALVMPFDQGTPEDVKDLLINACPEELVGSLLIGDIPAAIYEDQTDNETLPIDLFYADLNGTWADTDGNGYYDQHTGHRAPEIWVGRLKASNMSENEALLIKEYFDKNHAYRSGGSLIFDGALIYIDDQWIGSSAEIDADLSSLYDNRVLVDEPNITSAQDYLERLVQNISFVHFKAHGSYTRHTLRANGQWTWVKSEDIRLVNPRAFFYNLVSCKACAFSEPDYIGGWYLFGSYGLAVVGPTDNGGMLFCGDFYSNLSQHNLGESFKAWTIQRIAEEDDGHWYSYDWFYGLVLLGDPTLKIEGITKPVITYLGDVNGDKRVDMDDVSAIGIIFGSTLGDSRYDPRCDFNEDNIVDIFDLVVTAHLFGTTYS